MSRKPPYTNILGFLQNRSNLVSDCGQEIGASNSKEAWTKWLGGVVHVAEEVNGEMIVEVVEVGLVEVVAQEKFNIGLNHISGVGQAAGWEQVRCW